MQTFDKCLTKGKLRIKEANSDQKANLYTNSGSDVASGGLNHHDGGRSPIELLK